MQALTLWVLVGLPLQQRRNLKWLSLIGLLKSLTCQMSFVQQVRVHIAISLITLFIMDQLVFLNRAQGTKLKIIEIVSGANQFYQPYGIVLES